MRYQPAVAASVPVPVATSSLLLLPTLLWQIPPNAKIAFMVADATSFGEAMLGIADPADPARVVVGGVEGGTLVRNELLRPPPVTELVDIEADSTLCRMVMSSVT